MASRLRAFALARPSGKLRCAPLVLQIAAAHPRCTHAVMVVHAVMHAPAARTPTPTFGRALSPARCTLPWHAHSDVWQGLLPRRFFIGLHRRGAEAVPGRFEQGRAAQGPIQRRHRRQQSVRRGPGIHGERLRALWRSVGVPSRQPGVQRLLALVELHGVCARGGHRQHRYVLGQLLADVRAPEASRHPVEL
eukprot:329567-Prymnesium_polylepis.2